MGLEDIQKKIISDAEQKKDELLASAEQQYQATVAQATKDAQAYAEDHKKNALSIAENLQRGLIIDARRKLANEILLTKRNRIEEVFHKAKGQFISSSDYADIMKKLVVKSVLSKKEEVIVSSQEKVLDQKWLDSVNSTCNGSLVFSKEKGSFDGGVMLADGDTFINITLDTLLAVLREETEKSIANILFGG